MSILSGRLLSSPQTPLSRSSGDECGTGESEITRSAGDDGKGEDRKEASAPLLSFFPSFPVPPFLHFRFSFHFRPSAPIFYEEASAEQRGALTRSHTIGGLIFLLISLWQFQGH